MGRVLAGTNVVFPFSVMDLLLDEWEDGVHEVIWRDALLDDWEDVIVRGQKRTTETTASITAAVRQFFADTKVERDEYEQRIRQGSPSPSDARVPAAAAVSETPGRQRTGA